MSVLVQIRDETTAGVSTPAIQLTFPTEQTTVRQIIRERVYQEVQDYNRATTDVFRGLIQPTDTEAALNGFRMKHKREIDWKQQFAKACEAYESSRILVLVGDRQTESLDQTVTLSRGVDVTFLRLVPLVGG